MKELCLAVAPRLRVPSSPMRFAYAAFLDGLGERAREYLRRDRLELPQKHQALWTQRMKTAWSDLTHGQRRDALKQAKQQYKWPPGLPPVEAEASGDDESDSGSCASEGWEGGTADLTLEFLDLQFWECYLDCNEPFQAKEEDGLTILHFLDGVQWNE